MDVLIYANYGVLAHEKHPVYTTAPETTAICSEPFYIIIPDSMKPYITKTDEIAVTLPNCCMPYMLCELLHTDRNDMPVLEWMDKNGKRCRYSPGTYSA